MIRPIAHTGKHFFGFVGRHYWLIAVLVLLMAVRVALPFVLRPVLADQLSTAINGHVEIGQVRVWLLYGAVSLQDVKIFTSSPKTAPVITWHNLYARLHWLDLLKHTLHFAELRLEFPSAAIKRLKNGTLSITKLILPTHEQTQRPAPGKTGWTFAIDHLILRSGDVAFRDYKVGNPKTIELNIDQLQVTKFAVHRQQYDQPARAELTAHIAGAPLQLTGSLRYTETGVSATASVKGHQIPLRFARFYLSEPGWTKLRGKLDMALIYQFATDRHETLQGRLGIHDLVINIAGDPAPALQWTSLNVNLDTIDLLTHQAAINTIAVNDATVSVHPTATPVLPLLNRQHTHTETATTTAAVKTHTDKAGDNVWRWTVAKTDIQHSHLLILGPGRPVNIGVKISAQQLSSSDGKKAPVEIRLSEGDGSLTGTGKLRIQPVAFTGKVGWKNLSLPQLLAASGVTLGKLTTTGRTNGALALTVENENTATAAGRGSAATPTKLLANGRIEIDDLALAGEDPQSFAVQWKMLAIAIQEMQIPVIPPTTATGKAVPPMLVQLSRINLVKPSVRLTRTAEGLVIPSLLSESKSPSPPSERHMRIEADGITVNQGQFTLIDRSVQPFYRSQFSNLEASTNHIAWPKLRIADLSLQLTGPQDGRIAVSGEINPSKTHLKLDSQQIGLLPFNPYVTTYSDYFINQGKLTLHSAVDIAGNTFDSNNYLILHNLHVKGKSGKDVFRQQFGIPLSLALALLRNPAGNISLHVPISGNTTTQGAHIGLRSTVASALRNAVLNTIASPLKLIGQVTLKGGKVQRLQVAPISFLPGRITARHESQIQKLATLVVQHPDLAIELQGLTGKSDLRWLREQQLLSELQQGMLFSLTKSKAQAVQSYLAAKMAGQTVEPAPSVAASLQDLLPQIKISTTRLALLGNERVLRVRDILEQQYGIRFQRLKLQAATGQASKEKPRVQVSLHTAS